jgi:hypothetical protein
MQQQQQQQWQQPAQLQWPSQPAAYPQQQQQQCTIVQGNGMPMAPSGLMYASTRSCASLVCGVILILCGVCSIIFNIVDIGVTYSSAFFDDSQSDEMKVLAGLMNFRTTGFVGHGFWSGVMCIVAGSISITRPTKCVRFSTIILMSIAGAMSALQFGIGCLGAWYSRYFYFYADEYCGNDGHDYHSSSYSELCVKMRSLVAMESLLAILGFVQLVVAVIAAATGCRSLGCCHDVTSSPANHF